MGKIGKASRSQQRAHCDSPGPASYNQEFSWKKDQWTFGVRGYENMKLCGSPGPGTYEGKIVKALPLGKFGKEQRSAREKRCDSPGPGSYNPLSSWNKNQWTIARKRYDRECENDCSPGPGFYFPEINDKGPAFSIAGKNKKKQRRSDCPGPDTYFPSINPTRPRAKSAKFSKGKRYKDYNSCQPGPGEYKIKSTLGGPKAVLSGRPKAKKKWSDPGPGAYNVHQSNNQRPQSAKFGTAKRMPILNDCTPGPGSYNNWDLRDPRWATFGTSKRPKTAKKSWDPGPGAYNIRSTLCEKPGKTIAGKRRSHSIECTPGPGSYKIKMDRGVAYSLQGRHGKDPKYCENKCKPAPGAYNPSYDLVLPHNPGKTIAGKRKDKFNNCEPGPGSYNVKVEQGLACSIKGKHKDPISGKECEPGPDAYSPDYRITKPFSPGKTIAGKRNEKMCDSGPGPGEYVLKESDTNKGWTMAHRPKSADLWTGPGPGAYDVKATLWQKSGITIAGKRQELAIWDDQPGPGSYNPKLSGGIAYSIQGRHLHDPAANENCKKPGPNSYDPNYRLTLPNYPGKSIGMKYQEKLFDDGPGPGQYKFQDLWDKSKGWTIGHRPKTADSALSPGPGEYDIKTTLFDKPGKTIAGKRPSHSAETGPGPGMYDIKLDPGIAYSIQGKYRTNYEMNENLSKPGPSYYPNIDLTKPYYPGKTIAGKRNSVEKFDDLPGPGSYNPRMDKGLAFTIQGRHDRDPEMLENMRKPGPSYYPNVDFTKPNNPGKSFGIRYPDGRSDEVPGPGSYNARNPEWCKKGWTIAQRPRSANPDPSPGPAAYDIKTTIFDKPGKTIAGKPHNALPGETPGPGMYNPKLDKGPAFTIQGRYNDAYEQNEINSKPGPNQYYPSIDPIKPNYPGKTISARPNEKSTEDGPGPGMYNPKLDRGIAYSIQGRYANDFEMLENMKKPGPQSYYPNYDPVRNNNPGKTMAGRYEGRQLDEIPGPGSYNARQPEWCKKGWTIGHKLGNTLNLAN
jgi:hypothetical protein